MLRLRLHGRRFNCNRIAFDAVTHFVNAAPIKTDIETWVVVKTLPKLSVEFFQNDTVLLVV